MKRLLELVKCIPESAGLIDTIYYKEDKINSLYRLIKEGIVEDKILEEKLCSHSTQPSYMLWTLKEKLHKRLVNTLLSIKESGQEIQKVYFDCYRSLSAFKILRGRGKLKAAMYIADRTMRKAINYHFSDIAFELSKTLRYHYANIEPSKVSFNKYSCLANKYRLIKEIESLLEEELHELLFILNTKNRFTKKDKKAFDRMEQIAIKSRTQEKSYQIYLLSGQILSYCCQINNDTEKLISVCEETINYFNELPDFGTPAKLSFTFKTIPSYMSLGKYRECENVVQGCLSMIKPTNINYQRILQYYVILHLHQERYEQAKELILNNKAKYDSERWTILKTYCDILLGQSVKLGKFLNEVPKYSADKKGMNINILLIQILTYLSRKEFNKVIDRMSALEIYSYRHLKTDETKRAGLLIDAILCLEKGYFKGVSVNQRAKKFISKLKKKPLTIQDVDNEVVPYEHLWDFVLKCLY